MILKCFARGINSVTKSLKLITACLIYIIRLLRSNYAINYNIAKYDIVTYTHIIYFNIIIILFDYIIWTVLSIGLPLTTENRMYTRMGERESYWFKIRTSFKLRTLELIIHKFIQVYK